MSNLSNPKKQKTSALSSNSIVSSLLVHTEQINDKTKLQKISSEKKNQLGQGTNLERHQDASSKCKTEQSINRLHSIKHIKQSLKVFLSDSQVTCQPSQSHVLWPSIIIKEKVMSSSSSPTSQTSNKKYEIDCSFNDVTNKFSQKNTIISKISIDELSNNPSIELSIVRQISPFVKNIDRVTQHSKVCVFQYECQKFKM